MSSAIGSGGKKKIREKSQEIEPSERSSEQQRVGGGVSWWKFGSWLRFRWICPGSERGAEGDQRGVSVLAIAINNDMIYETVPLLSFSWFVPELFFFFNPP